MIRPPRRLFTLPHARSAWAVPLCVLLAAAAHPVDPPHTYDGKHSIATIDLTAVYFVPKDRTPAPDWKDRANYYLRRIEAFHRRELDGMSKLSAVLHPKPFTSTKTTAELREGDQNATFFRTTGDVRSNLPWPPKERKGYPILLVLSDINWRDLDDFTRLRTKDGRKVHEGAIGPDGRHFPGAEAGGARATYLDAEGLGIGLVSADGWRVPYSGSDCVVYHEGVGHSIGLPHPDPIDASVMGVGQYRYWLNETWINADQKRRLGWRPPAGKKLAPDLFTAFTAIPEPTVPAPGQKVALRLKWPAGAKVRSLKLRVQTEFPAPWRTVPTEVAGDAPSRIVLGTFDHPTPVSYRTDATLEDGQAVELWGYFQVRKKSGDDPSPGGKEKSN